PGRRDSSPMTVSIAAGTVPPTATTCTDCVIRGARNHDFRATASASGRADSRGETPRASCPVSSLGMIVLLTTNRWKIPEYRRFLARHAQTLVVEQPTESVARFLETARAVLADESNIFDLTGDLVTPDHVGPARNICRLHAWVK